VGPERGIVLAVVVVLAAMAFGTFFTPGMTMLSHAAEEVGLDYGYTFALVNVAWAPGQALGAAGSGALAHATSDALPYLLLSGSGTYAAPYGASRPSRRGVRQCRRACRHRPPPPATDPARWRRALEPPDDGLWCAGDPAAAGRERARGVGRRP
jgi:hypothetical protein